VTPQEAIEAAELAEAEERYRRQLGREMYEAGRRAAEAEAALRYDGLTREADEAVAALNDRRWGPGGRAHFGDPRPGDYLGRIPVPRQPEPEPEMEAEIA
jgi:hypothetical protein